MPRPIETKTLLRVRVGLIVLAVFLLVPIAAYIFTFGTSISDNHTRWSEMGSAMAGIYAPILTILTLLVLLVQVQLQGRLNEHTFDQSHVQDARADLHFYLEQLIAEISREFAEGTSVRAILITGFAYSSLENLATPQIVEASRRINKSHQSLVAMWSAYYAILAGLKVNDYPPYSNNYVTAKQKAIAMLSYECCAALDNLTWTVSEGRLNFGFEFSPVLPSSRRAA